MHAALQQKVDAVRGVLRRTAANLAPAAFSTSLGAEDMVLTDIIYDEALPIDIFTLDTGRLPDETYALIDRIGERYSRIPRVVVPEAGAVEACVARYGVNGFYDSIEARKACCHVRKVAPLRRALEGRVAWITALRREQSVTRTELALEEYDEAFGLTKVNPLAEWTHADVWNYLRAREVPRHELHDRGYPSIGCAPCTRAVRPGEDVRAGRWWWENPESKECGLHVRSDGRVARAKEPV